MEDDRKLPSKYKPVIIFTSCPNSDGNYELKLLKFNFRYDRIFESPPS